MQARTTEPAADASGGLRADLHGTAGPGPTPRHRRRNRLLATLIVVAVLGALLVGGWATDFVTLQGEWTIYTATCANGEWQGARCSGRLTASERYRFRALKAHREVLFWTVGETDGESGRYTQCDIVDGRNWRCPLNEHVARTITHRMTRGVPVSMAGDRHIAVHRVPKWKWEALSRGLPVGRSALD